MCPALWFIKRSLCFSILIIYSLPFLHFLVWQDIIPLYGECFLTNRTTTLKLHLILLTSSPWSSLPLSTYSFEGRSCINQISRIKTRPLAVTIKPELHHAMKLQILKSKNLKSALMDFCVTSFTTFLFNLSKMSLGLTQRTKQKRHSVFSRDSFVEAVLTVSGCSFLQLHLDWCFLR